MEQLGLMNTNDMKDMTLKARHKTIPASHRDFQKKACIISHVALKMTLSRHQEYYIACFQQTSTANLQRQQD
jgi:hypothetical protein